MADQLATPSDLASLLQQDIDTSTATLLVECATAVVQAAAGNQRIVQVVGDVASIMGVSDYWLSPPQLPVTAVTSVTLDGVALTLNTDYKVFGNRLFRKGGWQTNIGWPMDWPWGTWQQWPPAPPSSTSWFTGPEPSAVVVTYTHGYAPGSQQLQMGRQACLALAASVYANPDGAARLQIDDYAAQYDAMATRMEASQSLKAALRRQYGRRSGLVRIG